ncbi:MULTISPECIES: response regulator [unclassified Arsukibacterium]|mgnify:CR=1 FL=1|jgi:DNA-binding response OmpR family regulator|uniref:response regulator n=1 Tax=Chromatiaceae TaxID=1046 RepID=UPI000C37050C|nr:MULTISPECIES: response regulator [unclassified Arsukibacterium]MAA93794.1 DNA-binding response regulator [Rheinheimera sp.]MBU1308732.1 response regulator [Gammaproteobacteria bacterium]HAW92980.1 DNA-binding response regulator [Candidatus Azambacteria bacterium]MBM33038.1 DNA-binding response regulator [Rheinheimera sp.]MBU1556670.1 response regulator [Gammaproteobacteria bacterium]|tara:strand:- start:91012 stop:91680 length:669 start_codon:yes stop_codon:yes gene_type:complete
MRILLVEDDELLAKGMITRLKRMGYQVEHCSTGKQATSAAEDNSFSMMILDLGLPDGFALHLIGRFRKAGISMPILVLTAQGQLDSKLTALNSGADDYLVKPVDVLELEARIRVLLRRQQQRTDDVLELAGICLNLQNNQCTFQQQYLSLTRREFMLLKEFMLKPDRILSRQQLEELSYGWDGDTESNAIEVHIHNLRKKLNSEVIKTVRGIGYMLVSRYDH